MKFKKLILSIIVLICFIGISILFIQYNSEENSNNTESSNVSYNYSSFRVSNGTHFSPHIDLSSSQPYGKIFYTNNSYYSAKLIVDDKDPVIVEPYSSGSIVWKKETFKTTYDITVTATQGILDEYFTLAKAEKEEDFQN